MTARQRCSRPAAPSTSRHDADAGKGFVDDTRLTSFWPQCSRPVRDPFAASGHWAGSAGSTKREQGFPVLVEHAALDALLTAVCEALPLHDQPVHSLLTSDLGAPLPLHISLSRPFSLLTAEKAEFLNRLFSAISSVRVAPFSATFTSLDWFRSPDSPRAFLVLRVTTDAPDNRPLVTLLDRCNDEIASVGQPKLYANSIHSASAFHVSIAWTLSDEIDGWAETTAQTFAAWQQTRRAALQLHVDLVKAKIGNVVTDIPLAGKRAGHEKNVLGF